MNKKFKKRISILSAVLSICYVQNSKPASAANKSLIKGLAISVPSVLLVVLAAWGGVELVKNLKNKSNNDTEIENPGLIKDSLEIEKAKKLMDEAFKYEFEVAFRTCRFWCKHTGHGLELGKNFVKDGGFVQEVDDARLPDLKKFADHHFKLMHDCWNKNREKFSVLKRPGHLIYFEDLIFKFENLKIRLTVDKKSKQLIDLGIIFGPKNYTSCFWCFRAKKFCFFD